jgi:hypothetical protein
MQISSKDRHSLQHLLLLLLLQPIRELHHKATACQPRVVLDTLLTFVELKVEGVSPVRVDL